MMVRRHHLSPDEVVWWEEGYIKWYLSPISEESRSSFLPLPLIHNVPEIKTQYKQVESIEERPVYRLWELDLLRGSTPRHPSCILNNYFSFKDFTAHFFLPYNTLLLLIEARCLGSLSEYRKVIYTKIYFNFAQDFQTRITGLNDFMILEFRYPANHYFPFYSYVAYLD